MGNVNWVKIILFILKLIAEGMSEESAVCIASKRFGVSPDAIRSHGGF